MLEFFLTLITTLRSAARTRRDLVLENLALRHQLSVLRRPGPPSQAWHAFLANHMKDIVSVDFFTVPTAGFRVLFVFLVLAHDRRRVLHFNITDQPTADWTARQIIEAFPWETAPRYLLRDRDAVYGSRFRCRVAALGIAEVLTAARSPWQNPYVERLIGSIAKILPSRGLSSRQHTARSWSFLKPAASTTATSAAPPEAPEQQPQTGVRTCSDYQRAPRLGPSHPARPTKRLQSRGWCENLELDLCLLEDPTTTPPHAAEFWRETAMHQRRSELR